MSTIFFANPRADYNKACALIARLKQAGIEANIIVDGVSIYAEETQLAQMTTICSEFDVIPQKDEMSYQMMRVLKPEAAQKYKDEMIASAQSKH